MEKTVVELFAGVGGFRCGLNKVKLRYGKAVENGDFDFVWANQWEPSTKIQHAFECYKKRFAYDKNISNEDITKVDKEGIPNHTLLVGGFPCQDYSVARSLTNGKGIQGKKGVLWWEIDKIIRVKNPPFVLLENVDRLLISPAKQRGRDFGIMLKCFHDNGYGVEWRVINAGEYGFPQKRRRVFIFAFKETTKYYKNLTKKNPDKILSEYGIFSNQFPIYQDFLKSHSFNIDEGYTDLLELSNKYKNDFLNSGIMINGEGKTAKVKSNYDETFPLRKILFRKQISEDYFLDKNTKKKFEYLKGAKKIPRINPNGENYNYSEGAMPFPENLNSPARTLLTSERSVNRSTHVVEDYKTKKLRFITPVEAERINCFPDNWTNTGMPEKRRYFMMGNALVVGVIEKIGLEIEKIISDES